MLRHSPKRVRVSNICGLRLQKPRLSINGFWKQKPRRFVLGLSGSQNAGSRDSSGVGTCVARPSTFRSKTCRNHTLTIDLGYSYVTAASDHTSTITYLQFRNDCCRRRFVCVFVGNWFVKYPCIRRRTFLGVPLGVLDPKSWQHLIAADVPG